MTNLAIHLWLFCAKAPRRIDVIDPDAEVGRVLADLVREGLMTHFQAADGRWWAQSMVPASSRAFDGVDIDAVHRRGRLGEVDHSDLPRSSNALRDASSASRSHDVAAIR